MARLGVAGGFAATLALLALTGCGAPGAPQPPSLKLPEPVADLTAVRNGDTVELRWTMPKRTTDRLPIATQFHGPVRAQVCRYEAGGPCQHAGSVAVAQDAKEAEFREALPAALAAGPPRKLVYTVDLLSPKGRSASASNVAAIVAGAAPAPVSGLRAEVRADGVALHWEAVGGASAAGEAILLHRKLLTPPPPKSSTGNGGLKPSPEPVDRDLLVDPTAAGVNAAEAKGNGALDATARFGEVYRYTAQRLERVTIDGQAMELAGEESTPLRVEVADTFPPATPRGLAAVFAPEEKTIDLSWEPDTEEDLAGYIVYRADGVAAWKRISGAEPLPGPAYRDGAVEPGHRYRYAVTAIDLTGHESPRSAEANETVPGP